MASDEVAPLAEVLADARHSLRQHGYTRAKRDMAHHVIELEGALRELRDAVASWTDGPVSNDVGNAMDRAERALDG